MKLRHLKVRPRKLQAAAPCLPEMSAMLDCWSKTGVDAPMCAHTAKALANCMQNLPKRSKQANSINYHLARLGKLL
ncbi:mitochondrial 37S ribosomal protein mS37 [Calcarisporiella thermophila]|uniref:mitochondrial 37S ribosomal protein mS37 n=1 Tax=Calcarisporiella thermophila TaxID=911321 RepID=UPI00374341BB